MINTEYQRNFIGDFSSFNSFTGFCDGNNASSDIIEEYSYDPDGIRIKTKKFDAANTTIYTPFKEFMMIKNLGGQKEDV